MSLWLPDLAAPKAADLQGAAWGGRSGMAFLHILVQILRRMAHCHRAVVTAF